MVVNTYFPDLRPARLMVRSGMPKFRREYSHLAADMEDIALATKARLTAVMRASLSDLIDNAQTPTAKGGRMRVDTGFLRASGRASLNGMPSGPGRGERTERHAYDDGNGADSSIAVTLGKMKLGATFHFGWTANYARYRELYDGFLEGALQHWARIVAFNTDRLREKIKK
jgi:hypothetical protein